MLNETITVTQTVTRLPDGSFIHEKGESQRPLSVAERIALTTGNLVNRNGDEIIIKPTPPDHSQRRQHNMV